MLIINKTVTFRVQTYLLLVPNIPISTSQRMIGESYGCGCIFVKRKWLSDKHVYGRRDVCKGFASSNNRLSVSENKIESNLFSIALYYH